MRTPDADDGPGPGRLARAAEQQRDRLPAPTICATRYRTDTVTDEVPAAIRTGRSRMRACDHVGERERAPQLRTSSATRNRTTSQATRKPNE
ncbi:hypothetical protein GCM10023238_29460 [Streptomyces heliomycini]